MTRNTLDQAIRDALAAPDDVARLIRLARFDLEYGPLTYCEDCGADTLAECTCSAPYPGFKQACEAVREWLADIGTVYVDDDAYVTTAEPQGYDDGDEWIEPIPYSEVDSRTVKRALLGSLAEYL